MTPPPEPCTLVIDTQYWLDMLVFADPGTTRLLHLLEAGGIALTTPAMRAELADVLTRAQFHCPPERQAALLGRFDTLTRLVPVAPDARLPCTDPDDLKFIDLAITHRCWLVSRDKAVLATRRVAARRFGVPIGRVQDLYAWLDGTNAAGANPSSPIPPTPDMPRPLNPEGSEP